MFPEGPAWLLARTGEIRKRPPEDFHPILNDIGDVAVKEAELSIAEGFPILVGKYTDWRINNYFAGIGFRPDQASTAWTYANCLKVFLEWLAVQRRPGGGRGVMWDEATFRTMRNYSHYRLRNMDASERVSAAAWNKDLAALRHFYTFMSLHFDVANPITDTIIDTGGSDDSVPSLKATGRGGLERYLENDEVLLLRDVGLLGYRTRLVGRSLEPTEQMGTRQLNEARNVAFLTVGVTSGLRREEMAALLTVELPEDVGRTAMVAWATSKWRKRKQQDRPWMIINENGFYALDQYLDHERARAVARAQKAGWYERVANRIDIAEVVIDRGITKLRTIDDRVLRLSAQDPSERRRLYQRDKDGLLAPMALWLDAKGRPVAYGTWNEMFKTATKRVNRERVRHGLRPDFAVSVKTMRTTFALHLLVAGIAAIDDAQGTSGQPWREDRYDPAFLEVKQLLGHSSVEVTKSHYLEPVMAMRNEVQTQGRSLQDIVADLAKVSPSMRAGR